MPRTALVLLTIVLHALPAGAQARADSTTPVVVTSGTASISRAPDQAFVTLAVETRARTPRDAQRLNAEAMAAVQRRVTGAGIARDAVRTTGYSIQQEFDFTNGRRTPRGYVARNGLEVRVDAVERVGDLLDAVVEAGATTVAGVRFDLKDRAAVEREALRLAVADARARADAMAAGAGRTIDGVLRISDRVEPSPVPFEPALMRAQPQAAEATHIEAGLIEVRVRVELTAGLK